MKIENVSELKEILSKPQQICEEIARSKYMKDGETQLSDIYRRVANKLSQAPAGRDYEERFYQHMESGRGIGAGRIMSATGTDINATSINCFVLEVGDCVNGTDENGNPGIYETLNEAAQTLRRGGGVGYNFSLIRPKGAYVRGTHSFASGPCSYIDVFDTSCRTVESAGGRRGAQMGILEVQHPDIVSFIEAKRTPGRWNYFNVSVYISDEFMNAVVKDLEWELWHTAKPADKPVPIIQKKYRGKEVTGYVYGKVRARDLWDKIMKSNYDFAEPGVLFSDNINRDNNLRYVEYISATNPCAEQPLPQYGCCDLGPINLTKFVVNPFTEEAFFDLDSFRKSCALQVRVLDSVLDTTFWPLEAQKKESDSKRRIGVGITGLGSALCMLRMKYNSEAAVNFTKDILEQMRDSCYIQSIKLSMEHGPFPLFNAEKYLEKGTFASRLPEDIKEKIRENGIRNSHLLSIAPTGTVSIAFCENSSSGIEPIFSYFYLRKVVNRMDHTKKDEYLVMDYTVREYLKYLINNSREEEAVKIYNDMVSGNTPDLPEYFVSALTMTAEEHLKVLEVAAPLIDTSISKTVNVPADYPYEDFKSIYMIAHKAGLKGLSTYRPNNILGSVLSEIKKDEPVKEDKKVEIVNILDEFLHTEIVKRPEESLPSMTSRVRFYNKNGDEINIYVIVSFLERHFNIEGVDYVIKRPFEIFIPNHNQGENAQWLTALAIASSMACRNGVRSAIKTLEELRKITDTNSPIRFGYYVKEDGTKVPMWHESAVGVVAYEILNIFNRVGLYDIKSKHMYEDKQILEYNKVLDSKMTSEPTLTEQEARVLNGVISGEKCPECGAHAVVKRDGCKTCTSCGYVGSCG